MDNRRESPRTRTLRGGKIVLNRKGSVIDCTVRNLSADGACLQVEATADIPPTFGLMLEGEQDSRTCRLIWQSANRLGVEFRGARAECQENVQPHAQTGPLDRNSGSEERPPADIVRGELLRLHAALDKVKFGVVLLDPELRAQFINRAFRRMWRLSDAQAESRPAFVALMYHGRDTRAYEIPEPDLDAYIAKRVALVKAGDSEPLDLRLANGEVVRFQCIDLPDGGRMVSYTFVTDIVRHADELEVLRAALDQVSQGVILLDLRLNAQVMNRAVRRLWGVSDEQAERKPPYSELVNDSRFTKAYGVEPEDLDAFIARRIALVKAGDPVPMDLRVSDGRTIRSQCAVLPEGGRMLTYTDVTDLVRHAEELERLATIDAMSGVYNRRHFLVLAEAERNRFERYHRPLSLLIFDIDHFKSFNDGYGHDAGDRIIAHICELTTQIKRSSDIVARIGGDEFAMLLPEADLQQAETVADRLRLTIQNSSLLVDGAPMAPTISIGVAEATPSQSGIDALMKAADQALYQAKSSGRNRIVHFIGTTPPAFKTAAE